MCIRDSVNIAEKADDILEFLLGRRYYNDMKANGLTFGVIELGSAQGTASYGDT